MDRCDLRLEEGVVTLYINGLLHLSFRLKDLTGIQTWKEEKGFWCIEYYLGAEKILCEYDRKERWETIIKLLQDQCLLR